MRTSDWSLPGQRNGKKPKFSFDDMMGMQSDPIDLLIVEEGRKKKKMEKKPKGFLFSFLKAGFVLPKFYPSKTNKKE